MNIYYKENIYYLYLLLVKIMLKILRSEQKLSMFKLNSLHTNQQHIYTANTNEYNIHRKFTIKSDSTCEITAGAFY